MRTLVALFSLAVALASAIPSNAAVTVAKVDPEAGSNTMDAVFDAAIGERIMAVSSAIGCTVTVDEEKKTGHAVCTVPLASIKVDNDETKTEHFQQWVTNKKVDAKQCEFKLDLPNVKVDSTIEPMKPAAFETTGTFTVCGRARDDNGAEIIRGTLIYLPAGSYKPNRTLRIRATVDGFNRERYGIGPGFTPGWLARVQQLVPVVAKDGAISVNLFAVEVTPEKSAEAK
jgi:polyisoprenoid-binding protein YceI